MKTLFETIKTTVKAVVTAKVERKFTIEISEKEADLLYRFMKREQEALIDDAYSFADVAVFFNILESLRELE